MQALCCLHHDHHGLYCSQAVPACLEFCQIMRPAVTGISTSSTSTVLEAHVTTQRLTLHTVHLEQELHHSCTLTDTAKPSPWRMQFDTYVRHLFEPSFLPPIMAVCIDSSKGLFLQGAAQDRCFTGQISSGKRHGSGQYTYANSFFSYQGEYRKGRKHGHGKFLMRDGGFYEGQFVDDEIQGTGTRRFANGNVYTGSFVLGHMHGTGTLHQANGDKYEGDFEHNLFQGGGVYTFADGSRFEGRLQNHRFHGWGQMSYADGNRYEGLWRLGVRSGHGECSYSDGNHYKGDWQNDQPEGEGVLTLAGHGIHYKGHGFKAGAPEHVAAKLNALYLADDPAGRPDKMRASKPGGKEPSTAARESSAPLAPLQVLPGQPFPVAVTVAAQAEAPCPPQPRASDCSSDTLAAGSNESTAPQASAAAVRSTSQPGAADRPPSAASAARLAAGSSQQTPRQRPVTASAPGPGMQWVTAAMEYGRTVHMTLHREPPQPLPEGRLLSALLCITAESGEKGEQLQEGVLDTSVRMRLLIVPGVCLEPAQPLDMLDSGTVTTMRSMKLEAGQHVLQPQDLVLGRARPDGSPLLDGGGYCLVFSSHGMGCGHLLVALPASAPVKKGAAPAAAAKKG